MIEDRGSMIATHDRGQDVRKQEVLQRVPLNPGALIIDPLNHTNEPFWIGKRGTPLRVGKHLHGDEHFDEVLELPPPIGIERLPPPAPTPSPGRQPNPTANLLSRR